jgi:hydrogenase-4 component B
MSGLVTENAITSSLPLAIVLIPILGAALVPLAGRFNDWCRNSLVLAVTALVLILSVNLLRLSWQGDVIGLLPVGFGDLPLYFRVDRLGAVFNLLSAFIWFLATVFSLSYMTHESRHSRYYLFYLLSLGGCLGVFLTADLFSLFFFFELMSIASYLLVIHTQTEEAMKAGKLYLFLGVGGGLCIIAATAMIYWFVGTVALIPMLEQLMVLPVRYLILVLLIIGFGIKAGMVPLHIWLPKAHPVAPAPASALLSGIMIKTGAYGIIRVITVIYTPASEEAGALWASAAQNGYVLIWFGILTMFSAAFMALFQGNAKRILAYSSVSQMGYILMGIGACAYLGLEGPMAFGGFTFHVVNHAFFKAGMFMMVGMVYFRTGEIELNRLGGLWRDFPVTTVVFLIAAMGIAGIPGLNGYTSKVMLHHAIVEAFEHHHDYSLYIAERIFTLTSAMTTCYIARLFSSVFLGQKPDGLKISGKESWNEKAVFITIGAAILFIGTSPFLILKSLIGPVVQSFPFDGYSFNYFMKLNFWDRHDLEGMVVIVAIAAVLFVVGNRTGLFTRKLPPWLSIECLIYNPLVSILAFIYTRAGRAMELSVDSVYIQSPRLLTYYCISGQVVDDSVNKGFYATPVLLAKTSAGAVYLEEQLFSRYGIKVLRIIANTGDAVYSLWVLFIKHIFSSIGQTLKNMFMLLFKFDYSARGDKRFQTINISNLDFDLYILLIVIGAILATSLIFLL